MTNNPADLADNSDRRVLTGQYRRCLVCQAPWVEPFPDDWTLQIRRTPGGRTLLTPHRDDCPPLSGSNAGTVWGPSLAQEPVTITVTVLGTILDFAVDGRTL